MINAAHKTSATVLAISILLLATLPCCHAQDKTPPPPKKTPAAAAIATPDQPAQEKPFMPAYKEEVYGDPETFSTPRLQFTWSPPKKDQPRWNQKWIWSVRLDGSDLRRVIDPKLLYSKAKDANVLHPPVRSPNNRYLAAAIDAGDVYYRMLYDLKEKTATVMTTGGFEPQFLWTKDSKKVIFYADKHWEYDVQKKKLSQRPMIYGSGTYLIDNDKRFLSMSRTGYDIYEYDRTWVKEVVLGTNLIDNNHGLSLDGKYLAYYMYDESQEEQPGYTVVINRKKPSIPILKVSSFCRNPSFTPDTKNLYCCTGKIFKYELNSKTKSEILSFYPNGVISYLTLINGQSHGK